MVSRQTLEAIGTRKGREADEGKAPEGVELMFGMKDTAWYSVERDAAKCKIHKKLHLNDVGSIKPLQNTKGFNVAMTRFPSRAEKHRGEPLSLTKTNFMEKTENNRCPTCGANLDYAVLYPEGYAFCMECGEVFSLAEKGEAEQKKK